jgi:glycosyltransferase involved in cell wall biosynthesis
VTYEGGVAQWRYMLISVIMPVKNNEKIFPHAVSCILNQQYTDWELIIMEGCSSDRTRELADSYAESDERIRVFHVDEWIYESINIGIYHAKGEYITFLNSDDKLAEDALAIAADYIDRYGVDLFLFPVGVYRVDSQQNIIEDCTPPIFNVLDKELVLQDAKSVRDYWEDLFFFSGLLQNQLNVYKKKVVEGIRFRNDYVNADQLYNLEVMPKVNSLAYYPKVLYQFLEYQKTDNMNASVGKFYEYHFDMCNELYYRTLNLFASYNLDSDRVKHLLREKRITSIISELETYKFENCDISFTEKILKIMQHVNYWKDIFIIENRFEELENKVIAVCYELYMLSRLEEEQISSEIYEIIVGIIEIFSISSKGPQGVDIKKIYGLVKAYNNPAHIGISILNELL